MVREVYAVPISGGWADLAGSRCLFCQERHGCCWALCGGAAGEAVSSEGDIPDHCARGSAASDTGEGSPYRSCANHPILWAWSFSWVHSCPLVVCFGTAFGSWPAHCWLSELPCAVVLLLTAVPHRSPGGSSVNLRMHWRVLSSA